MAPSNPEPPTVPEDVGSTLRTSDPTTETPPQPTATTSNTSSSSSNAASGTLCSVCSAPTSNRRARKAGAASDGTRPTSTQAGENDLGQHEPGLDGDSSDDSEDEELPPPADPNGVSVGKKIKGKLAQMNRPPAQLVDLLGDLQKTDKDKKGAEEEKVVRERASKLEFRRLDELYNKNIHDFYLAESSALSSQKEDKWEEYIFIVRRRFDWQNRYQKTFVDIKSLGLKELLKEILEGVVGISLVEDKPTIEPNLLFNYLPELTAQLSKHEASENPDATLISHLKLLIDYIQADYADIQKRLFPMLANSEISFELLWALFLPNSLIFTIDPGSDEDRLLKLDWAELRETVDRGKFYQLECHYVDFDGKIFGEATCTLDIPEFRGVRKIEQLGVYPIQYHNAEDALRQRLIERGKKFCELKGMHYRMYQGNAYYKKKKGFVKVNIDGRVMIDPLTFRRINPNYRLAPVKDFDAGTAKPHRGDDDDFDDCCGGIIGGGGGGDGGLAGDDDDDDDFNSAAPAAPAATSTNRLKSALRSAAARRRYTIDELGKVRLVANPASTTVVPGRPNAGADGEHQNEGDKNPENMTEEDLLLCSPTVLGFSFSDKLWVELAVSNISDIEWNAGAFDSLVLPEAQKRIVRALVESHTKQSAQNKGGFDDFIKGKGKGLVAVLHGRPGVGKTLTAEGISEYLKRPLYCVGAGELGTDPRTLEQQLGRILDVAHVWGAVLLLDEADVFLERRSVHDLHRNALVSIFLRLLEYFQGILFLTTNRVETFDEAFQSRIHIALRYSDLDRKAKKQIWSSFLNIVARDEVSDAPADSSVSVREVVTKEELENLARRELNGRQIKNVVRTAQALAQNKGEKLGMSHLREVLDVTEGFERDLKGTGQLEGMMSYA